MSNEAEKRAAQTVKREPDRPSRLFRVVKPSALTMKTEGCWLTKGVINCTDGCNRHYEDDNRNCKWKLCVYGCAIKQEHINQYALKWENGTFVALHEMIVVESAMNLPCTMMHACSRVDVHVVDDGEGDQGRQLATCRAGNRLHRHRPVM